MSVDCTAAAVVVDSIWIHSSMARSAGAVWGTGKQTKV